MIDDGRRFFFGNPFPDHARGAVMHLVKGEVEIALRIDVGDLPPGISAGMQGIGCVAVEMLARSSSPPDYATVGVVVEAFAQVVNGR